MAYAAKEDIQADFKDMEFSSETNVKDTDVVQFIIESDSLINAYVGAKYVVPVISGDGLTLLKLLTRSLTALRIKKIMEVKQETNTDGNQNVLSVLLSLQKVMDILKDIKEGKIKLDGATPLTAGSGFYSSNAASNVKPVIRKDIKQW